MKYPKSDGKPWDAMTRSWFDYWREQFATTLKIDNETLKLNLTTKQIETEAWNMAFQVVTLRPQMAKV